MSNPIPTAVRGWLYVLGIVVGSFVAVVLPDLLVALNAGPQWTTFATRGVGALTILLATLGRSHLSEPVPAPAAPEIVAEDPAEDGAEPVA